MNKEIYEYMVKVVDNEFILPCFVEFHPTNKCNQDCVWCIMRKHRMKNYSFKQEQLQELGRQVIEGKYLRYFFFSGGGEPLCNDALFEKYVYKDSTYNSFFEMFNKNGINSSISTNGELLNQIVDSDAWKYIDMIRISIDAGNEETYRKLHRSRRKMPLVEIVRGIERYYQISGKKVEISFLETAENRGEYRALANLFSEPQSVFRIILKNLIGDVEQEDPLALEINSIKITRKLPSSNTLNNYVNRTKILINANGDVYPCCHAMDDEKNKLGNLHIEELDKIILKNKKVVAVYQCPKCANLPINKVFNEFSSIYYRRKYGDIQRPGEDEECNII